jgi:spore germination protein YaaH
MKKWILILLSISLIALGIFWGYTAIGKLTKERTAYLAGHQLIYNDEPLAKGDLYRIISGQVYLNLEFIKEKELIDYRYSGSKKRILFKVNQNNLVYENTKTQHYLRNSGFEVNLPILFLEEGQFIELESLSRFANCDILVTEDPERLILDTTEYKTYTARLSEERVPLKMNPQLTGLTLEILSKFEEVRIFKETTKAYKVRLTNGLTGYLGKDQIDLIEEVAKEPTWKIDQVPVFKKYFQIGVAWDMIESYSDNVDKRPQGREPGLDVLSPTWFRLTNDGWVLNDADMGYMKAAEASGYAVWPLFSNDFDPELTHGMLQSEKLRRQVIAQLIQYAGVYGFGGINVDFENVYLADRDLMTTFIKELSTQMHAMGMVLSVDVTVPWGSDQWSKFLDRVSMEPFVDYFMLMAYDEHWAASPIAGSVASLPWVERGVKESLKLIPKEKLILGLPLYMRVWTEKTENGKVTVSSKTLSIVNMKEFLKEQLHLKIWDPEVGQSTLNYQENGDVKKVWIEDEESLTLKLQIMRDYELAGAAVWRKGFESPWLWALMERLLKR